MLKNVFHHPDSDHLHVCQVEVRPGEVDSNCLWGTKCGCWTKSNCG